MLKLVLRYVHGGETWPEWHFWVLDARGHRVEIEVIRWTMEWRVTAWGGRFVGGHTLAVVPRQSGVWVSVLGLLRAALAEVQR